MQLYCGLFFVLISAVANPCCAVVNEYNIYPEAMCQNLTSVSGECLTFADVVNDIYIYFTSNSTLVFHDGDHFLQGNIISVSHVNHFSLQGYNGSGSGHSSPTITCINSSLSFSLASIKISSIKFSYCSIRLWQAAAVFRDSKFENGRALDGGALAMYYSNVQFDGANTFGSNTAGRYGGALYSTRSNLVFSGNTVWEDNKAVYGGAVACIESVTLSFDENIAFINNEADYHGGALYVGSSNTVGFRGNSRYVSNTAVSAGGAVYAAVSNTLSFSGNNIMFMNNFAKIGGAVCALHSNTLSFSGNSFVNSTANMNGGALYVSNSNTLSFSGNSFVNSTANMNGGALYVSNSNTLSFSGNSFVNSTAKMKGGAVYASDSNTLIFVGETQFMSNVALAGVVVYTSDRNTLIFSGNSSFTNNIAVGNGGAIFAVSSNMFSFSGTSRFLSNTAVVTGGAVYAVTSNKLSFSGNSSFMDSTANKDGGAVYALNSNTLSFIGKSSFMSNTALVSGGAVYGSDSNTLSFSGLNRFTRNTASTGGAVVAKSSNTMNFIGIIRFLNNTAVAFGGAVYAENSNMFNFNVNAHFKNNTAHVFGGALYTSNGNTLRFSGKNTFMSNTALKGGAVFTNDNNSLIFSGNNSFMKNRAVKNGGAVYAVNSNTLTFTGNSTFVNTTNVTVYAVNSNTLVFTGISSFVSNTAESNGGAVYAQNGNTMYFKGNNTFMSNQALVKTGGAFYALDGNTLIFSEETRFLSNMALVGGGAVSASDNNTLIFSGNSSFMNNTAVANGGAVLASDGNFLSFSGTSSFMSNTAYHGGGVFAAANNSLEFYGDSSFIGNSAHYKGGAVAAGQDAPNTLLFDGNNRFIGNTAQYGGAVSADHDNNYVFTGRNSFVDNAAEFGGAVYIESENTLYFDGKNTFTRNTAVTSGGAVYVADYCFFSIIGNSSFMNNTARHGTGGAVYTDTESAMKFSGTGLLEGNVAARGGGFALVSNGVAVSHGSITMLFNTAQFGGGAFLHSSSFTCLGNVTVIGNEALQGGAFFVQSSNITLQGDGEILENMATNTGLEGGYGGAVLARNSVVSFQGSFNVSSNTADFGGGLALFGVYDGALLIKNHTELSFERNLAHRRGGAIFVEDDAFTFCTFDNNESSQVDNGCFFQLEEGRLDCLSAPTRQKLDITTVALNFDSNAATESGDIVYGGHLESCIVCGKSKVYYYGLGSEVLHNISIYTYFESDEYSNMSSDPYKVCICENSVPNCDQREVDVTVYPGQVLETSVVAVGQMNGTVPSVIRAVSDNLIKNTDFKEAQPVENNQKCSLLQYPLVSNFSQVTLELYSDEPCSTSGYPLTLQINFLPCPLGFSLSGQGTCICDERLQKYTQNCSIQTLTIRRREIDSFWVGVEGSEKLILNPHCPFDYCIEESTDVPLNKTANYNGTDVQCAKGRSGILCGACRSGHSLALGSSRCLSGCSNKFLTLLLTFSFAGVVLVAFLFVCRLTVAEGTLSGLIFYANILAVTQTVFFPSGEHNLLTVFIAWLNLDLGIEVCFFDNLDTYYSTWLQFAFPIYIWAIVGMIIVLADRSVLIARIIGSANPVAILATLFLLSYTKLLRAIMTAFSFTTLNYPDDDSKYVWLYDGNVGYLDRHDGRHIGLFLFSLLFFLFVFLPYTLLLLCGQWIQKKLWWLSPTWQLYVNSFLDAYYAPYKDKHRYWTGLLLLVRFFVLFVGTIINISNPQDPFSNLLVIQVVSILASYWVIRGLYKKWYLDLLETSFHFNLIVLVGGTYYVRQSGGNQAALVYTSVGTSFAIFIGIVINAVVRRVKEKVAQLQRRAISQDANTISDNEGDEVHVLDTVAASTVTYSELEIIRSDPQQTMGELVLRPVDPDSTELSKL